MPNAAHRFQSAALTVIAASFALACGAAPTSFDDEPPAASDELTNSPQSTEGPWVVDISSPAGGCTASLLSPRWLLTAAHCIDGNANGDNLVVRTAPNIPAFYNGPANYHMHPDYGGLSLWGTSDTDDDVALIELTGTVNTPPGTAALYEDALSTDYYVKVIAFGLGSDPGQSSDCDDGASGIKRQKSYRLTTVEHEKLELDYDDSEVCPGDSGSPWHFTVSSKEMITSVTANRRPYKDSDSARLHPKLDWLETKSASVGRPLTCPTYTLSGRKYRECFESAQRVRSIAAGMQHACAALSDGRVRCWGRGSEGQAGPAASTSNAAPLEVALGTGEKATEVALGRLHSCALLEDLTVRCWGSNSYGQMGNQATGGNYYTPQIVRMANGQPLNGILRISAGGYHSCGVRYDGTAYCWGENSWGQLGNSSTTSSNVARQVGRYQKPIFNPGLAKQFGPITILQQWVPEQNIVKVSAGLNHTCAMLSDGKAKCWGDNSYGKLGDGSTTGRTIAGHVYGLTNVEDIASGLYHTCAVRNVEPRVACWGYNGFGQLANGGTGNSYYPWHSNLGMTGSANVAVGAYHSCFAGESAGKLRCAGYNGLGALGVTGSPTGLVDSLLTTEVSRVAAGEYFTCTRMDGGNIACNGSNNYGQLGLGTTQDQPVPQNVPDLNTLP